MGTILKGLQSVLIALGIIAIAGTGAVLYYNHVAEVQEEELAADASSEGDDNSVTSVEIPVSAEGDDTATETDGTASDGDTSAEASNGSDAASGHEHTYKKTILKPASCTQNGEMKYTCYCGDTYVEDIEVKPHTVGNWITIRLSTDVQTGLRQKSCTVCGKVLEEETLAMTPASSTTSKNDGKNTTDDHAHSYTYEITTEPTCTEKGEKTFTCVTCGSTFKTTLAAKNHPSRRTVRTEGNCGTEGKIETVCNLCDTVITSETLTYAHDWDNWVVTTQPTATAAGEKTRTCKDCGSTETASVSKLSGSAAQNGTTGGTTGTTPGGTTGSTTTGGSTTCNHNFILTSSIAATCETGSTSVYTCNQCGATKTETGEAIGHIFGDWYISLPPTATEDGMQEKICYRCGKKETQTLAKTPEKHICSYLPEIVRQPSCTATGTKKYTCTICHYYYTTIIPATGHLDTNGDNKCDKCRTAM